MSNESIIPWAKPEFWGNERNYTDQALTSTWISGGPFVDRFEHDFAKHCGRRFALTASNGTTALHMAYLALGLGPGDEVVFPGFGFMGEVSSPFSSTRFIGRSMSTEGTAESRALV